MYMYLYISLICNYKALPDTVAVAPDDEGNKDDMWVAEEDI